MVRTQNDDLLDDEKIDYIEERNLLLKDIPYHTVRRAWFILAHLLLEKGSHVVDMGCGDGTLTYAMSVLNPHLHFTGIDKSSQKTNEAQEKYQAPNLDFKTGDVSGDLFESESVDAIINSFILHQVFSNARYNERIISDTLRRQFSMLKNGGTMFIHDYARPPPEEYVLMEMHDEQSTGESLSELSEADLLVWYSEHARPKQDPGCGGFFLEELEPRFPRTRLFRLPYKWAYEFIMRKDDREHWETHLPFEYTFYTIPEFRNELKAVGARVRYCAPQWDEEYITKNFEGHFRLLNDNGDPLGDPSTGFVVVSQKQPERAGLNVHERRISHDEAGSLHIKTLRNQEDGDLIDVVTRDKEIAEILPYRIGDDGRLNIYLHDEVIRGITNAVCRSGVNIDGHKWSGHMLEAISTNYEDMLELGVITPEVTEDFAWSYIGLHAQERRTMEKGPFYYPDPNFIDERIHTYYLPIEDKRKTLIPKKKLLETHHFREKGKIREFDAQNVLDAIAVGYIPNARLELQILSLMQFLEVRAENWTSKDFYIASSKISQTFGIKDFLKQISKADKRFKEVRTAAGQLRTIDSIFVEEGQSQGGLTGLSSEVVDFVISDEKTVNTAVVLPLSKSIKGDIHAGFNMKFLPVPQRFEGNGLCATAPQFNIPKEIKDYKMLKQFIAERFGVTPDMVIKMGESYFTHAGITPQRIYPFAVAAPADKFKDPGMTFIPIYQYMLLWKSLSKEQHFMTILARAYRFLPGHMKLQAKHDVKIILDEIFKAAQPDWSMPVSIEPTKKLTKPQKGKKDDKDDTDTKMPILQNLTKRYGAGGTKDKATIKKEKKRRKKLGLGQGKDDIQDLSEAGTSGDAESLEAENKKEDKNSADHVDISLIEDFEQELQDIKDALEEEDKPDPKPEKW